MPIAPWPPVLSRSVQGDGCMTRLKFVINQPTRELERRIGYGAGRLDGGWWLLLLMESVQASDYEFFGHTHFSGGRIGHPAGGASRPSVEQDLRGRLSPEGFNRQKQAVAAGMVLSGSDRIAKVVPRDGKDPARNDAENFPVGSGVPQWNLLVPKRFVVAADIKDGRTYSGGGAGFWIDPAKANTM